MSTRQIHAIVIGGGAAGFFGAIAAAEHPLTTVTILEAGKQVLTKVRISGGGRCNVTHACFEPARLVANYPRGGKALRGALSRFQPRDTVNWFQHRRVTLKTEPDGRMFPVTDDSATIINCLTHAARQAGVAVKTGAPVVTVRAANSPTPSFTLQLKSGDTLVGDRLLLATGSNPQGYRLARELGHDIVPPVPSLFTFTIRDPRLTDLAGVSVPTANLRLQVGSDKLEQSGPLLVTHWGLSGPAVLKLSAWGARLLHNSNYRAVLTVNWIPTFTEDRVRQQLLATKTQTPRQAIASRALFDLPKRLWRSLTYAASISPTHRWADLSKRHVHRLTQELIHGQYEVVGKGTFKDEFVTCGGVNLKQVDFKTLQSRITPGLYFAGEVLDIDGITGGFNFQNAWTTAWHAGHAIGQSAI